MMKKGKLLFESDKKYLKKLKISGIFLITFCIFVITWMILLFFGGIKHAVLIIVILILLFPIHLGLTEFNYSTLKIYDKGIIIPTILVKNTISKKRIFLEYKNILNIKITKGKVGFISIFIEYNEKLFDDNVLTSSINKKYEINWMVVGKKGIIKLVAIFKKYCPDVKIKVKKVD